MSAPSRAALAALVLLTGLAWWESGSGLVRDDFGYLMWGLLHRDEPLAWLRGPEWHTYVRPLNALVWWLGAKVDLAATVPRIALVLAWAATASSLVWTARRAMGVVVVATLLVATNQVFVDVLAWRSWLTTGGSLALMAWAVVSIVRGRSAAIVLVLGTLSLGFKEMGALVVAVFALGRSGYRVVGAVLCVLVVLSGGESVQKLALGSVVGNARFHLDTLGLFLPVVPVVVAALRPGLHPVLLVCIAPLALLPLPLQGVAVAMALVAVAVSERSSAPALAVALLLPLLGTAQARQYLCELWLLSALLVLPKLGARLSPALWLAMILCGARTAVDFERARSGSRAAFAHQVVFLETFHPAPAQVLYDPDPNWSWDLDALVWVRGGARLGGTPPEGSRPAQVGPLSGVWADVVYGSGSK